MIDQPNIPLPSSSVNEDLETVSRYRFSQLFDPKLFELRPEISRDKGVDFFLELKQNGAYTNFRFAVQLKSTMSVGKNTDGSISYPVDASNIGYLTNLPMPAYYVLYDHNEDVFYFERSFSAYKSLLEKYPKGNFPIQFKVRFSTELSADLIKGIYNDTLQRGSLYKEIIPHLEQVSGKKRSGGIVIDKDNAVYSVEQLILYLERYGIAMINDSAFGMIIEIEQRSHPRDGVSGVFSLICGMAYYYSGKVFKSLEFLKIANKEKAGLEPVLKKTLAYTLLRAEHDAGILKVKKLESKTLLLMEGDDIGSFLEIEKAWKKLESAQRFGPEGPKEFYGVVKGIIEKEADNPKTRIMGYARIVKADMLILMNDLGKNLFTATCRTDGKMKVAVRARFANLEREFLSRIEALLIFVERCKDFQALANISMMRIEWFYNKAFTFHLYENWDFATLKSDGQIPMDLVKEFERHLGFLDKSTEFFNSLGGQEGNLVAVLWLRYKILHFLQLPDAVSVKQELKAVLASHESLIVQKQYNKQLKSGTDHERYVANAVACLSQIYLIAKNEGIEQYLLGDGGRQVADEDGNMEWTISELMEFDFPLIS